MSENIYGGAFPWANLFGVSSLGGGMSDEDLAWQAYLEYSGLPQAGVSGDDYLGSFLPEIDTSALSAEMEGSDVDLGGLPSLAELIAGGTLTGDASGVPGPAPIDDSPYIGDGEIVYIDENNNGINDLEEDDLPMGSSPTDENGGYFNNLWNTLSGIMTIAGNPTNPNAIQEGLENIDTAGINNIEDTIEDISESDVVAPFIDDYTPVLDEYFGEGAGEGAGGLREGVGEGQALFSEWLDVPLDHPLLTDH